MRTCNYREILCALAFALAAPLPADAVEVRNLDSVPRRLTIVEAGAEREIHIQPGQSYYAPYTSVELRLHGSPDTLRARGRESYIIEDNTLYLQRRNDNRIF